MTLDAIREFMRWSDYTCDPPEIVEHQVAAPAIPFTMTDAEAAAFARAHVDTWNSRDLDAVMADYTDDVVLTSPVAHALTGSPMVRGKAALRDYFASGLTKYPELRFDLHQTFRGEQGLTLLFRGAGGRMVAEVLRLDRNRKIARVDAHYACDAGA
jgi:ketosteroid isomerase-like protein